MALRQEFVSSLRHRIGRSPTRVHFQVDGDRLEQFATGCKLALVTGDKVLEPSGKRTGLCIAAHLEHVGSPVRILGFRIKSHDMCPNETRLSVIASEVLVVRKRSVFGRNAVYDYAARLATTRAGARPCPWTDLLRFA